MAGIFWVLIGIAAGLATGLVFLRLRTGALLPEGGAETAARAAPAELRPTRTTAPSPARSFSGVTIEAGLHPCEAVRALDGQRFLSDAAPALPLPGCDSKRCGCRYRHHADRRDSENRRAPWGNFGGFGPRGGGRNERKGDRRRSGRGKKA